MENCNQVMQCCSQNVSIFSFVHVLYAHVFCIFLKILRLGYNPCDFMDTMSKLSKQWLLYMDGKLTTKELIEEYEARGFDCNQDIPGNYYWEELYNALGPDTKVILTVRDSTERKRFRVYLD